MKYLNNRNLIIVAIVLVLLLGGYYLSGSKQTTTSSKDEGVSDNVDLNNADDSKTSSTDDKMKEDSKVSNANVSSTIPASGASLTTKPTEVVVKVTKELAAGSEIKVVSDKNLDVVTGGNKLAADLKTLTAPVEITVAGTYSVSYTLNWKVGASTTGSYKFTVK